MNDMSKLEKLLNNLYGLTGTVLYSLNSDTEKLIYCVEQQSQPRFILRAYPFYHNNSLLELIAILSFLEAQDYPSERMVAAKSGTLTTSHEGWQFLLTTYIAGSAADFTLPTLHKLGATLGQLHALCVPTMNTSHPLPEAEMLPRREIAYALSQLTSIEHLLPKNLSKRYDILQSALHALDLFEDLPATLMHNDAHPGNAIMTPVGQLVFIDWEGAGLGPAVIDVGFLLASCDTVSPWTPPLRPDPKRVEVLVAGYCEHHTLRTAELDRLPDAIRFRALIYGAVSFATSVKQRGREDEDQWWWRRYEAAEDIAERAQRQFTEYSLRI